jgi:hypothetical protein
MIKKAHTQVQDLLSQLEKTLDTASTEDLVQIGDFLWRLVSRANEVMSPIKIALRDEAYEQMASGSGSVQICGHEHTTCMVTVPKPSLRIKKGADLVSLKAALKERFDDLFLKEVKYKPKPDIEEACISLPEDLRDSVMNTLDHIENTPRVSFKG